MKTIEYNKETELLEIKFRCEKEEFYEILEQVKNLASRKFDFVNKIWTAPPLKTTIDILSKLGFDFQESTFELFGKNENKKEEWKNIELDQKCIVGLRKYQVDGVRFVVYNKGNCIIGDEMGLGKTVQALAYLKTKDRDKSVLIVCPASLKENWKREYKKWVGYNDVVELYGNTVYEFSEIVAIINYDILGSWYKYIIEEMQPDILIADEIQYIKNRKANRTKVFQVIAENTKEKIFLSGTPIENRPSEFFTSLNLLNKKLFSNRWRYLNRFCDPKHNGFGWSFNGLTNGTELFELVKKVMIRRKKSEVLKDLPLKQRIVIPLELSRDSKNWANYEELENEINGWREEKKLSKLEKRNHFEKLKQLAYALKRKSVIEWIKDRIEEGSKIVIFAVHTKVIDDIYNEFKDISVMIDGRVDQRKRQGIVDQFQTDPEIKLFIGQIRAAGVGLNLTAANATCFVEFDWVAAKHDQAEDRIHRIGQEADSVFAYYLLARETVEEKIMKILQQKFKQLSEVLDGEENAEYFNSSILDELLECI